MNIQHLWFYPPLAFARLGGSDTPLECFYWGDDDNLPHGTGKTTILPGLTLVVADDGGLSSYLPTEITFKDHDLFRPVCPFYELHARWTTDEGSQHEGPVTEQLLAEANLKLSDLTWEITVANLKPFNMTQDHDTRIECSVTINGDDVQPKPLLGTAPADAKNPLVPKDRSIPLGTVRLTKPDTSFPGVRLRFTPGKGLFYGPTNLLDRWQTISLDDKFLYLNKDSTWCSWSPAADDARGTPGGQYAQDANAVSYGMVDDVCDGIITCRLNAHGSGEAAPLEAHARISVAPPDYAPDRRHLVSLADGLKDRVDRKDVFADDYLADDDLCDAEIRELMQRIYETASLNNVDVFNQRVNIQENPAMAIQLGIPFRPNEYIAFPTPPPLDRRPLPLSDTAVEFHRRFQVLTVFLDMVRKQPNLFKRYVRQPLDQNLFFDNRMPAVMRGPSGDPLTLTRRQYEFLMRFIAKRSQVSDTKTGG